MTKKINIYLLLFTFSILYTIVDAQITLTGTIKEIDGKPINSVNVNVKGLSVNAVSDDLGQYVLKNVPEGKQIIVFSVNGFRTDEKKIFVAQDETLDIVMENERTELQSVEIIGVKAVKYKNDISFSGTKSGELIKNVPQQIQYVTKELILDQAAFTVNDIVKNMSGVNQSTGYNDIAIRGFRVSGQDNNGNLINGLRAFTSLWSQSLMVNIERVEIIKGPSSALFGNAPPGGSINRVTKKPLRDAVQSVSTSVGSFGTLRALGDFTGPLSKDGKLLYRINLGYQTTESFRDLQGSKNIVIAPSFSFIPTERTSVNVDIVYQDSRGRIDRGQAVFSNGDLYSVPISSSKSAINDYLNEVSLNSTLSFQHKFSEYISFNSSYLVSSYDEDLLEHRSVGTYAQNVKGVNDLTRLTMRVSIRKRKWINHNVNNYLNINFKTGIIEHKLLLGYDYFNNTLEPGGSQLDANTYLLTNGTATVKYDVAKSANYQKDLNGNLVFNVAPFDLTSTLSNNYRDMSKYVFSTSSFDRYQQVSNGFYIQEQFKIKNLRVLLSLRQDYFKDYTNYKTDKETTTTQSSLIPKIGVVYSITPNINLYSTWSKGYQPQSATSLQKPNSGGPFAPLISEIFEVGGKSEFFNKKLSVTTSIYYLTQKGTLYPAGDATNPDLLEQIGKEFSRGIELDIVGNILPNWSINVGGSYNDAQVTDGKAPALTRTGLVNALFLNIQKQGVPKYMANLWTKYIIDKGFLNGLGIGLGFTYVAARYGLLPQTDKFEDIPVFPQYQTVDLALYYKLNKVQFQLNFNNVFDKVYWVGGYDYVRMFPGKPRNFMITVSYLF